MTLAVLRATPGASLSQPTIAVVRLGENTAEATRQAVRAEAAADNLTGLLTAHPVSTFMGVASPVSGGGTGYGQHALLGTALPAETVIESLEIYVNVATNITLQAATATNLSDGRITASSIRTRSGPTVVKYVPSAGVATFTAAELAPLGDLSNKFIDIVGAFSHLAGTPSGNTVWAEVNDGTGAVDPLASTTILQIRVNFHSTYTYTLDYTGQQLIDMLAAQPSDNAVALKAAARTNGFFPQPLTRTPAANIPTVAVGVADAVSAINARAAGTPLLLLTDAKLKWLAGPTTQDGSGSWFARGAWDGATRSSQYSAFEFSHTGTDLEICALGSFYAAASNLRVLVDDRIAAVTTVPSATGSFYYIRLTFPSSATRRIRIESAAGKFRGVNVTSASEIASTGRTYPLATIIGDSFGEGTGSNYYDGETVALLRALGCNVANAGVGGTGMLNPGTGGKVAWTDATRMTDLTMAGVTDALGGSTVPALGVVCASINDQGMASANWNGAANYQEAIGKAVFTLIDAWIAANPGKPLVFIGPTWTNEAPVLDIYRMRDAVQEACWAYAGANVWFIDRLGPDPLLRKGTRVFLSTTGNTTNASAVVTNMASQTGLVAGAGVSGPGIPAGATVKTVDSGTQVTLSHNATATATGAALVFRNDQASLYSYDPGDQTHPSQAGHNLDALWMARELRRLILGEFA